MDYKLRVKGRAQPPPLSQPAYTPKPPVADWNHISQPVAQQRISTPPSSGVDVTEESLPVQEGQSWKFRFISANKTIRTYKNPKYLN